MKSNRSHGGRIIKYIEFRNVSKDTSSSMSFYITCATIVLFHLYLEYLNRSEIIIPIYSTSVHLHALSKKADSEI